MKTLEGNLVSKGIKIGIVAARFNEFITSKLLGGARDGLLRHNVQEEDIHVAWVLRENCSASMCSRRSSAKICSSSAGSFCLLLIMIILSVPVSHASSIVWRRLTISMALRAQS